jgi:hypothetical protein
MGAGLAGRRGCGWGVVSLVHVNMRPLCSIDLILSTFSLLSIMFLICESSVTVERICYVCFLLFLVCISLFGIRLYLFGVHNLALGDMIAINHSAKSPDTNCF